MTGAVNTGGGHSSPTSLSRTLEKVLEDAEQTGEILLSGRKIKDFAKVSSKYDLSDATIAGERSTLTSLHSDLLSSDHLVVLTSVQQRTAE